MLRLRDITLCITVLMLTFFIGGCKPEGSLHGGNLAEGAAAEGGDENMEMVDEGEVTVVAPETQTLNVGETFGDLTVHGNVAFITAIDYKVSGGSKTVREKYVFTADETGRVLSREAYDKDDTPTKSDYYEYDGFGLKTGGQRLGPEGNILTTSAYTYDEMGRVIEESKVFITDAENMTGVTLYEKTFDYDEEGNITMESMSVPDDFASLFGNSFRKEYMYEGGNLVTTLEYNKDEALVFKGVSTYDGNKETKYEEYTGEELTLIHDNTYDGDTKAKTIVTTADGTPLGQTVYEYDDAGRIVKETFLGPDGNQTLSVNTFEYDEKGNPTLIDYETIRLEVSYQYNE